MIGWGIFGGLLPEVIRIVKNMYNPHFPDFYKHWMFWLGLIFHAALGGILVYLLIQSGKELTALDSLVYGYVAPSVIASLAAKIGKTKSKDNNDIQISKEDSKIEQFELRKWWGMYTSAIDTLGARTKNAEFSDLTYTITPTDAKMKIESLRIGYAEGNGGFPSGKVFKADVTNNQSKTRLSVKEGIPNSSFSIKVTREINNVSKAFTVSGKTGPIGSGTIEET